MYAYSISPKMSVRLSVLLQEDAASTEHDAAAWCEGITSDYKVTFQKPADTLLNRDVYTPQVELVHALGLHVILLLFPSS